MILLGIDPGTATSGWGVIDASNPRKLRPIEYGNIKTDKESLMEARLVKIHNSIRHVIDTYHPQIMVIEKLFFNTNVKTAMTVGQARGVYLLTAGEYELPVFEYTALEAKMKLTGYGRAEKDEVRAKVKEYLNIHTDIKPIDASDALAMTICHVIKTAL